MYTILYSTYFPFQMHFKMSSAIYFDLNLSNIVSSGNGLNNVYLGIQILAENVSLLRGPRKKKKMNKQLTYSVLYESPNYVQEKKKDT